jgi:hypothetical protein
MYEAYKLRNGYSSIWDSPDVTGSSSNLPDVMNQRLALKEQLKNDFIWSLVALLEEVKQKSVDNHNITITTAVVARPSWVDNEFDDVIDEACLLAEIEVFEQPKSRVELAAITEEKRGHGHVMVLEHSLQQLLFIRYQ